MRTPLVVLGCFLGCAAQTPDLGPAATAQAPKAQAKAEPVYPHATGVINEALAALLQNHWEDHLARSPTKATDIGDHRYDDQLPDNSEQGLANARAANRLFLADAKKLTDLNAADEVTRSLFVRMLEDNIAAEVCRFEEWTLSPRSNPVTFLNGLAQVHKVRTPEDAQRLVRRFEKAGAYIDNVVNHLRRGTKAGLFPNAESTRRVLKMVGDQRAQALDDWPMFEPAKAEHPNWTLQQRNGFRSGLRKALMSGVKPALERYRDFIKAEILPHARSDDQPGLSPLPLAKDCYEALIRQHTTLDKTAQDIHETGLAEIARINGNMKALGRKLFGVDDLPEILKKLRTNPELYFDSAESVEAKATSALDKARKAIPSYFGILPQADCVVSRIPAYQAPFTTIAYYRRPVPTGDRPGQYFINVYAPKTRPRYEMEALSFHESIPGHHLQIAIAQERSTLPAFRRHLQMTAFVEGWALYSEQLADEMGLYSSDLDRMGMHSYEAWRAARLVVDTGLHAMGWSREQAKTFMLEHTALAANNIDNEVDRYIVWPGQALAYKTGQIEIWRLRREAERALGDRFDIKAFHDAVLGQGAVSLPVLQRQVQAWIQN